MEEALTQIKSLAAQADGAARQKLMAQLRDLMVSLEDADDTVERISYAMLETFTAQIGVDLGVFELLAASAVPLPLAQLAEATSAEPVLLGRLLRYWASVAMVAEVDADTFTANRVTHVLASRKGKNYVRVHYELVAPAMYELPRFLQRTGYVNPTDPLHLPLQDAFHWEGDLFAYFKAFPTKAALFDEHMQVQRDRITNWDKLSALVQSKQSVPGDILFVDVGGGVGHQSRRFREAFPNLQGRMIVEDLPEVMQAAKDIPGVEKLGYNFFTPQPVKGAKFYYFRGVLHDFTDEKARTILGNTVAVMGPESSILVDEMVLPDKNVHWGATKMDLKMMANLGSQERTRSQWLALFESVGLRVTDIISHGLDAYQAIMVTTKAV
ncbi:o-methyltransferas-like protein [Aspergillus heteromorphus CBS 117.55]|uniref:O-methyltransferas-like protein n=1 Tax=Aspergillus heteromorphus CBS 117.55 TaxID=1448321 RepID=A0A317V3M9_9EURO|nr:o-methyltransferas-like protein [Aspergillus heteromorphus CBS 117.55]PWY67951.1 o-methyltransferas-like protein [Aspergillus heteromorphus CBS 117.55]